ncbi:MAG TPA: hypothetical protein VN915_01440 [Elusimicrobiota bacterium]|nr:hypothetical protein [Elusimicrobiota bacterium]
MIAPVVAVRLAMARIDALVAKETGRDAAVVAELDRKADAEFKGLAPLGWRAAAPLGEAAADKTRAPKTRFFAVVFLGELHDVAAFEPLSRVLLDEGADPEARLSAAQGVAALDAPPEAERKVLCAAVAQPELPRPVLDESLIALTRLGCPEPAPLERAARLFGPRPADADLADARRALQALAKTRGEEPVRRLLVLSVYFPSGTPARAAAIDALAARQADLVSALAPQALSVVRGLLRAETADPATMLTLIRLADAFGPEADEMLVPLASHPDAEVLAAAAEALARRKAVAALPALEAVLAHPLDDPRFGPKPGRPDPAALLARIEAATAVLRRARSALK